MCHVVGHPVDLGGPALPESLVELLPELFEGLLVGLPQRQGVLWVEGLLTA